MKRTLLTLCTVLVFGLASFAQTTASSKTTKTSTTKATKSGEHQLTGCLGGPNAENAYVLTNGTYKKGIEVGGNDELAKHVGHKVQLMGTWETSGAAIGESEKNEKGEKSEKSEKGEKHFKVSSIKHLADSCTMRAAGGKHKKGSAGGTSQPSTPPK